MALPSKHQGNRDPRVPCPECDGEGQYEVTRPLANDPADTVMRDCEDCSGSGIQACDHCSDDAFREFTVDAAGTTFFYCSAKCRREDLGDDEYV